MSVLNAQSRKQPVKIKSKAMLYAVSILALTIGGLTASSQAQTPQFAFQPVSVPGAAQTNAYAINNKKVIAGDYINAAGEQLGMFLQGSNVTSFTCPSGGPTYIFSVNSAKKGAADCPGGGGAKVPGPPNFYEAVNQHINPEDFVCECPGPDTYDISIDRIWVGSFLVQQEGQEQTEAFSYNQKNKTFTPLVPDPSAQNTWAWAINNEGLITLQAQNADGFFDSYLYNGTSFTLIDVPGAQQSWAYGINNNGDIVYSFIDGNGNSHGALYLASTGQFYLFDNPNGQGTTAAYGLNDEVAGKDGTTLEIVGQYSIPATGQLNSYEATVTITP